MIDSKQLVQDVINGDESADHACDLLLDEIKELQRCFGEIYEGSIHELNQIKHTEIHQQWLDSESKKIAEYRKGVKELIPNIQPKRISIFYTGRNPRITRKLESTISIAPLRGLMESFDFELQRQQREIYKPTR